ncbi:hypothetical protein K435DRAFT_940503 [Dendrothele bispora CBS 962.96]|uniref:Glutathione S-transferase UstS-like C-terminal domain-containing protein n=1 Tax=Dendrothele bispora (strain CBS 962.96) TaxID=1314807 RepID=A0A4S8M9W3_DENBC|nr:hypothetical protein K435DRAFT_940503 [Dendrothele bispora CBS 962.96]
MIYWPMFTPLLPFLCPKTTWILNQPSADYYWKHKSNIKMKNLYPSGEQKVIEWGKVEAAFDKIKMNG